MNYLTKNIEAVKRKDHALVVRLQQTALPEGQFAPMQAKNGLPLLAIRQPDGRAAALNNANDPKADAGAWAGGLGQECLRGAHVLLFGFASGYHALALFERSDEETLIRIVEPSLELFKAALHVQDFSRLILSDRVEFLCGLNEVEIAERLFDGTGANRTRAQGIRMLTFPVSAALYQPFLQSLSQTVQQAFEFDKLKFKSEEIQGKTILENAVENLPYILEGAPYLRLVGKAPGTPAFVIAPGPTLEEALPLVKQYREHALIFAVDTANRILHRNGIHADMVVSIDFTELNIKHFEALENDPAILATYVGVQPDIVQRYRGRTFFFTHESNRLVQSIPSLGPLGMVDSPGSTAHAAYFIARMMGCSPVILIGNDLAFPNAKWYADGAMQNDLHQPERETEPLLDVACNAGGTVKTSGLYKIYLDAFGKLIAETGGMVINTSPAGAVIGHTRWMRLQEALERYCRAKIDKGFLPNRLVPSLSAQHEAVMDGLEDLLQTCRAFSEEMTRLKQKAESLNLIPRKFHQGMRENMKEVQRLVDTYRTVISLTIPLCTRATTALFGQMGNVGILGGDTTEQNQTAKEKFVQFTNDFLAATELTSTSIEQAKRLLEQNQSPPA